jgi:hypothetical protein
MSTNPHLIDMHKHPDRWWHEYTPMSALTLQPHHPHHQSTRSAWTAIGHCSHLRPWQTTFRRQIRRIHTHILETFTGCQTGSLGPNTLARTSTALFTRRCTTPLHLLNLSHLPTTHHHPHHQGIKNNNRAEVAGASRDGGDDGGDGGEGGGG